MRPSTHVNIKKKRKKEHLCICRQSNIKIISEKPFQKFLVFIYFDSSGKPILVFLL